ncbi:MAG: Pls/PosA family non-ribosomal peptide synthetase, partial [Geminicoccaceae bacterium]
VCTDLFRIGDNTILRKDAIIRGYKARSNYIHTGSIEIGANCFVGEHGVLDINTAMEDHTQLGHASSLHEGQRVPAGKRYHGCRAVETEANYCPVEPMKCSTLRRWLYPLIPVGLGLVIGPLPLMVIYYFFPTIWGLMGGPNFPYDAPLAEIQWWATFLFPLSFALVFAVVLLGLLTIAGFPRLFNLFLKEGRTYVLYGIHYFIHGLVKGGSNSVFYNRLFGDSSAIPHYGRWIGYRMNRIIQTGSNFGMDQRHENPFLCDFGSGTMVSGGLKMINEVMSNTSFRLGKVVTGENSYLGNYLHIPTGARIGENVLLATKCLVPIDGPVRENVGLLGSPPFEIPRATSRDLEMAEMDDETRRRQLGRKNRYNFVSAMLFLLNNGFLVFALTLPAILSLLYYPLYGMASLYVAGTIAGVFGIFWLWFVERAILGFGRLSPKVVSMIKDPYFWFHERYWKLNGLWMVAPAFAGTPLKNAISRLQGVRIGKKVFDDGADFDEDTLIEIGDYTNLNAECVIQPHSLEEGVFKSDYIKIGKGCTLGVASNVHYGVTMGDFVELTPDSFVMKGEVVDSDTTWSGNPAKAVGTGAVCVDLSEETRPLQEAITA